MNIVAAILGFISLVVGTIIGIAPLVTAMTLIAPTAIVQTSAPVAHINGVEK